jgi:hypothetical protein
MTAQEFSEKYLLVAGFLVISLAGKVQAAEKPSLSPSVFLPNGQDLITWDEILTTPSISPPAGEPISTRLPDWVLPVLATWGWSEPEFKPRGYQPFIDQAAKHAAYNLLTTTLRIPKKELTDEEVHEHIKAAAVYARQRGMGIVMDLDVRLARAAFQKAYPDEMQEMLRLRTIDLKEAGDVTITVIPETPSDHYTFRATPYVPLAGRLVRVYSYLRGPEGIEPGSLRDITADCRVNQATAGGVSVSIPGTASSKGRQACVLAAFTHLSPDVFAPRLLSFQRELIRRYADCALAGACKDEWGFPPCYDGCPQKNDFWFSRWFAAAYSQRTAGRDLVRDCLLMYLGERGRVGERQAAINHYQEMCWQRNGAIEDDFYRAVKEVFGPGAAVCTHPTWWPNPDTREFKKNGLDWWVATRSWAQTDEVTPYCVRTALAKKWNSPVWYNMYYSTRLDDYRREIWSGVLTGGRVNFHPLYPRSQVQGSPYEALMRGGLMRGDSRIRLLNYIAKNPLDCPVAVVFGHACAMNWAGPAYDDVGLEVADRLRRAGFAADLIPADEIASRSLVLDPDGFVRYGPQRYAALVLYHPQFERSNTAEFFRQAAGKKTDLFRVGSWTTDFDSRPFNGNAALPPQMTAFATAASCVAALVERLRSRGQVPASSSDQALGWDRQHVVPPTTGRCRLIDGTIILAAGDKDPAGDPIRTTFEVDGRQVRVEGVGVVAVRLARDGKLEALAGGGLSLFEAGPFRIRLDQPVDLVFWRRADGQFEGVVQDCPGPIPPPLRAITPHWSRLAVPRALSR